ncbi:MAG: hypothetical protein WCB63_08500 [Polyangiales bacterium]|jgi:hypothetical protein
MVYLFSFMVFALALTGLSVGVLAGRGAIRGSCGGLNNPDGTGCGTCGRAASGQCPRKRDA